MTAGKTDEAVADHLSCAVHPTVAQRLLDYRCHDCGSAADRSVDDTPLGGGPGMVLRPDVVGEAVAAERLADAPLIYLTPRGRVLDLRVESETYPIAAAGLQADFARNDQVPFVDVVATLDAQSGQACVLMLNRDLDGEREIVLAWNELTPTRVLACETLTGSDLKAANTFDQPRRVTPQRLDPPSTPEAARRQSGALGLRPAAR